MQEYIAQDELNNDLDKMIARWNRIHRDLKIVPVFWGIAFLVFVIPMLIALPTLDSRNMPRFLAVLSTLATILLCIIGGTYTIWAVGYHRLLPKMLAFDDLRLVPCLIQATTPQHKKHLDKTLERLSRYLNVITINDSALLTDKEYALLHRYLLDLPLDTTDTAKNSSTFRLAILRVIRTMGHTQSISTIQKLLETYPVSLWSQDTVNRAATHCLAVLLEIQEHIKHDATLLRPSQQSATPETLLRAAMPTTPNNSSLLTPTDKLLQDEKNEI